MALLLEPYDPRLTWQGAVSLQRTDDWVMPWRIPFDEAGLFPPLALQVLGVLPRLFRPKVLIAEASIPAGILRGAQARLR